MKPKKTPWRTTLKRDAQTTKRLKSPKLSSLSPNVSSGMSEMAPARSSSSLIIPQYQREGHPSRLPGLVSNSCKDNLINIACLSACHLLHLQKTCSLSSLTSWSQCGHLADGLSPALYRRLPGRKLPVSIFIMKSSIT